MKIPNGMTKDQVVSIITDICSRFKFKYQIDIFDPDDVEQESFIICCEALERYDGIRPLENFLSFNLRNRLLNFVRDTKLKNVEMVTIPDEFDVEHNVKERLIIEIDNMMDNSLDPESRQDWLRLKDGVKVPTVRANKLKARIIEFHNEGLVDED
jgi:DNA-directed RNA polymerase specialized sigma24 family protein